MEDEEIEEKMEEEIRRQLEREDLQTRIFLLKWATGIFILAAITGFALRSWLFMFLFLLGAAMFAGKAHELHDRLKSLK